jgi:hypothetical protein
MKRIVDEAAGVGATESRVRAGVVALEVVAGAASGAVTGALAGPPGVAVGALLGAAVGAAAGAALHMEDVERDRHEEELDRAIGVIGGDLGAARSDAPPSRHGLFHAASLGVAGGTGASPSEGMMQNIDE